MRYIFNKYTAFLYIALVVFSMIVSPKNLGFNNITGHGETGDYFLHFFVFLPWMLIGDFVWGIKLIRWKWFVLGVLLATALEVSQIFIPYRGYDIWDLLVGVFGVICSYVQLLIINRIKDN